MLKAKWFIVLVCLQVAAFGQNVDSIINGYVRFIGGETKWQSIYTMVTAGSYNYGGMEFSYTTYAITPNKYKVIVSAPNGKYFMQAYNGLIGWRIDAFKSETTKTRLPDSSAKKLANEANAELEDAFVNYRQKGHTATYVGVDSVNGAAVYKVAFHKKSGEHETYFFNTQTYAIEKKQAIAKNEELENSLLDFFYSDYQLFDGIRMPAKTTVKFKEQTILTITTNVVRVNEPIETYVFDL